MPDVFRGRLPCSFRSSCSAAFCREEGECEVSLACKTAETAGEPCSISPHLHASTLSEDNTALSCFTHEYRPGSMHSHLPAVVLLNQLFV